LGTPREEGFVMPAEWAPHARCWMAWPCREEAFGDGLEAARRSYAEVARMMGDAKAVRAVARSCARNPVPLAVPCHRVIGSDGSLTGYRWGVPRKRALLEKEAAVRRISLAVAG